MKGKRLLVVGPGHAHLELISRIPKLLASGVDVTVVGPSPYHYYSGMAPGYLGGRYSVEEIRFPVQRLVEELGGAYVNGTVTGINPVERRVTVASGASHSYDVVSFDIGSEVAGYFGACGESRVYPVKPIGNLVSLRNDLLSAIDSTKESVRVIVVGGGPSGVEIAGNLLSMAARQNAANQLKVILLTSSGVLGRTTPHAGRIATRSLLRRGATVVEGERAVSVESGKVKTDAGKSYGADFIVLATGYRAPELFAKAGLPTGQDGGLLVDQSLRSLGSQSVFGAGDCASPEGRRVPRVGVLAVEAAPILADNVTSALIGTAPTSRFTPRSNFMLLYNLGDGRALLRKGRIALRSGLFLLLKDRIDRNFVRSHGGGQE